MPRWTIGEAASDEDLSAIRRLFEAYAASLPVDLGYQGFAEELESLPGAYAAPEGVLLLARHEAGQGVGCIAMRPLGDEGVCEMKRLYVQPAERGTGLGQALAEALIEQARGLGYREMRLDTLPSMTAAQSLYRRLGFAPIPAYYETPVVGTAFFRLRLD
jgi:GNAT superfamily N-acetyltransferase